MISSGIKRGLATSAVSALAVAGLPLLASSAHAVPLSSTVGANAVKFYSQNVAGLSDKNDGSNTTVSLVTGGGTNVTSVLYQYESSTALGTWVDVPGGLVARNADGVFAYDWAGVPETVTRVRAVPNTGLANAVEATAPNVADAAAQTVELGSEGALGVFQSPYLDGAGTSGSYVGVTGTVSANTASVNVSDASNGTAGTDTTVIDAPAAGATTTTFNSKLDIAGYSYSGGTEANQIALNAATANTDDAEASTLYVQKIGSITAAPATQEQADPTKSEIVIRVFDTTGEPVAGAQIGLADLDTDGAGPDTDGPDTILGYTDGYGQFVDTNRTTAGTFTYFVNTTDTNEYEPAIDKSTTATVTTYVPALASVDIVNEADRPNFDLDELGDGDDFTIVTKDQRGKVINEDLAGNDVEYRWVINPDGVGATFTSAWMGGETDANGEFPVAGLTDTSYNGGALPEGDYTLEARRPNVGGAGLMNATPETVSASESEITFGEGASANAPVNGDFTVNGNLANNGGLGGRLVRLTYVQGASNDAGFAPQSAQPAGVEVSPATGGVGSTATAVTAANGDFAVVLRDPKIPANVTPIAESGTLNAIAEESATDNTSLQGNLGPDDSAVANAPANAEQELVINWKQQAAVASITIGVEGLYGVPGPGRPVDLDIVAEDKDGNDLPDYPVTVSVDRGFLSPNAETLSALTLDEAHDETGDLWGFFKNIGQSQALSTGDAAQAGAVVAMERDADFDDDGLSTMTITVKAGNVTQTRTITFEVKNPINIADVQLDRAAGEPMGDVVVPGEVGFNLFTHDQFHNLAGDQDANITDNSTVADVDTDGDFGDTRSDFTTSNVGIRAFSDAPAVQTLTASLTVEKNLVDPNDDPAWSLETATGKSDPINWVAAPPVLVNDINLHLNGKNNGARADVLKANANNHAAGLVAKLYKRVNGTWKLVKSASLNSYGNHKFKVADKNGRKYTKYVVKVAKTDTTHADKASKRVR